MTTTEAIDICRACGGARNGHRGPDGGGCPGDFVVRRIAINGERSAYLNDRDGQVYVGSTNTMASDRYGMPSDARWESSLAHWERYFDAVHALSGWERCGVTA